MVNIALSENTKTLLSAANLKHGGATNRASALRSFLTIFHSYFLDILSISFSAAFNAVHLHLFFTPFRNLKIQTNYVVFK